MKTNDLENELGLSKHTIRYYEFHGPMSHLQYFFAALLSKDEQFMHYCL